MPGGQRGRAPLFHQWAADPTLFAVRDALPSPIGSPTGVAMNVREVWRQAGLTLEDTVIDAVTPHSTAAQRITNSPAAAQPVTGPTKNAGISPRSMVLDVPATGTGNPVRSETKTSAVQKHSANNPLGAARDSRTGNAEKATQGGRRGVGKSGRTDH